ncbi:MAG: FUSC family protein [Bryobacterales bacterium]|nr:FUSC family protein [Bryobacterales bacterium]
MSSDPAETQEVPLPAQPVRPNAWVALWRTIRRFDRAQIQPWLALRNSAGVGISLGVGLAAGSVSSGLVAATGALNVSYTDGSDPYLPRVQRMLAANALGTASVIAGPLCAPYPVFLLAVLVLWAAGAGILVALDAAAANIGVISLVTLVVYAAQPMPPEVAIYSGLLAFAGGLLQTALSAALWPVKRYEPERRVLGALYSELSRVAASPVRAMSAPPASAQSTEAQEVLSGLWRSRTVQGERYISLLNQAERLRLALMMMGRLRSRLARHSEAQAAAEMVENGLQMSSKLLASIGRSIESGVPLNPDPSWLSAIEDTGERLREFLSRDSSSALHAMVDDARHQVDAAAGQLRAAIDLSASSTLPARAAFERRESHKPWRLRLAGTFAILRANVTPRSAAFQHGIRLSLCMALGEPVSRALQLDRPYWVPMTIAIVLKPDFTSTFSRGALRVVGTYIGLILATLLFHAFSPPAWVEVGLVTILVFLFRCFGGTNYGVFAVLISAVVVLMFALAGVPPGEVIAGRGWSTLVGGVLALAVYAAWPTWERSQVSETLARLLDAYRAYFRTVRLAYAQPEQSFARELDRVRNEGRLARSNLEASVERFGSEPGVSANAVQRLNTILASSHRLAHALMALEAGLTRSRAAPARAAFIAFANQVELTQYLLAAALRGSPLRASELPDLRESHHTLLLSGNSPGERYTLVNIETDRLVNSLNTVSMQVLGWTGRKS